MNLWCFFWSITLPSADRRNHTFVLTGSHTPIIFSIVVHLLLSLALIYSSTTPKQAIKIKKPYAVPIKSFLYTLPKVITQKSRLIKSGLKKESTQKAPKQATKVQDQIKTLLATPKLNRSTKSAVKPLAKITHSAISTLNKIPIKNKSMKKNSFSSFDHLSRLRKKLDNKQRDQAFTELTQKRSVSIMHADPFPVPKTIVPLTQDQKYKLNTSSSHVGSITKHDNGTCTIHREQILGSPVEAITSSFACGESKFDKRFRQHMAKVQATLTVPNK